MKIFKYMIDFIFLENNLKNLQKKWLKIWKKRILFVINLYKIKRNKYYLKYQIKKKI